MTLPLASAAHPPLLDPSPCAPVIACPTCLAPVHSLGAAAPAPTSQFHCPPRPPLPAFISTGLHPARPRLRACIASHVMPHVPTLNARGDAAGRCSATPPRTRAELLWPDATLARCNAAHVAGSSSCQVNACTQPALSFTQRCGMLAEAGGEAGCDPISSACRIPAPAAPLLSCHCCSAPLPAHES